VNFDILVELGRIFLSLTGFLKEGKKEGRKLDVF